MLNLFHKHSNNNHNKDNHFQKYHNYTRITAPPVAIKFCISPSTPTEGNIQTQSQTTTNPVTTSIYTPPVAIPYATLVSKSSINATKKQLIHWELLQHYQ